VVPMTANYAGEVGKRVQEVQPAALRQVVERELCRGALLSRRKMLGL
jgi:hypothetical protein